MTDAERTENDDPSTAQMTPKQGMIAIGITLLISITGMTRPAWEGAFVAMGGDPATLDRLSGGSVTGGDALGGGGESVFTTDKGLFGLMPQGLVPRGRPASPVGVQCFRTQPYAPLDPAPALPPLDRDALAAHAKGRGSGSFGAPERHLGRRIASIMAVRTAAGPDELARAQAGYVEARMRALRDMHRMNGEPGLAAVKRAYRSKHDALVLQGIRATLLNDPAALERAGAKLDVVRLLTGNPPGFVPCIARWGPRGRPPLNHPSRQR